MMKQKSKTGHRPLRGTGRLRIGLSLAWLLLLLVVGGCTQTDVEDTQFPSHGLPDVEAGFHLNVLASRLAVTRSITFTPGGTIESDSLVVGVKDTVQTKAAAGLTEAEESRIASLWVGQYDATTGKRLFNDYLPSFAGPTVYLKLKQSQDGTKSHVYFISNVGDLGAIADEATLKKHTLTYASTAEGLPDNNLCKMMGMWEGEVVAGVVKDIAVELTRLLAKISFTYSTGSGFGFTPTSVVLKNAPTLSQVEAPAAQLTTGNSYKTYTGTADASGATVYWYLPENMAGSVSGDNVVDSEKKKIGRGVTNATCIELTGDAVQGGVTYKNVTFRFYPGSDMNNYDIPRNSHYSMAVTFVGIDVSDERITVGEIPPIVVDPSEMPAKKGGEKEIQITARPGQPWVFEMPSWLSALLNGQNIPSGATTTHQGPANVLFRAAEANPKAEQRSVSFTIDVNGTNKEITITQTGSTLTKGSNVSLTASADSEGSTSFTATEGLPWSASLSDGWLSWSATNPGSSGSDAPAGAQPLQVKATASNPSAQPRRGSITIKAGASIDEADYVNLTQEIGVEQAGATITGSTINNIAAHEVTGDASFTATKGLPWASSITSGNWITLNSGGSGTPTTGAVQSLNYTAAVNPSSDARSGEITVRAGDVSAGPAATITLTQSGSTFTVDPTEIELENTAATGSVTVTGTSGLPWTVSPSVATNGITPATSSSTATGNGQTLTFNAAKNSGGAREATFTVAVTGGDHSKTVKVKQKDGYPETIIKIDQSVLTSYRAVTTNMIRFPPFDYEGVNCLPNGSTYDGSSTMNGSYTIQVQKGQAMDFASYPTSQSYCSSLNEDGLSGWRIPTQIELHAMYINAAKIEGITGASAFIRNDYWSSSLPDGMSILRCEVSFQGGSFYTRQTSSGSYVRCVREI